VSAPGNGQAGWFKAVRSSVAGELIRANKNAFILLYVIAARARWRDGFNAHGLTQGESFIGDHDAYGMSEREYRTAKALLEKHGFASFKPTNKGTVATIENPTVFDIWQSQDDEQNVARPSDRRQTGGGQTPTNEEGKKGKQERRIDTSEGKPKATPTTARITRL
jgi:hypothetical protein